MTVTAFDQVCQRLLERGFGPGRNGTWRCPGHDDSTPSLSVSRGRDGAVLVHCHAGCETRELLAEVELTPGDLFDKSRENGRGGARRILRIHDYVDEQGALLYQTVRFEGTGDKRFRQRRPDGKGGWLWKLGDVRRVLYRLPEVLAAIEQGQTVLVAEGEHDADALSRAGAVATTNPLGAANWKAAYTRQLEGATVALVIDADPTGRRRGVTLRAELAAAGIEVTDVFEPIEGKDAAELLGMGYDLDSGFRHAKLDGTDSQVDGGPSQAVEGDATPPPDAVAPITLDDCHGVFCRWLGEGYDLDALDAVLCTLAAERLGGDPLWLLIISGPGNAKTETVQAAVGAGAIVVSTLSSDAALLSGTPQRQRAKDATGGLLCEIGRRGVLAVKDVTSILAMNRDTRGALLAALREVHDGYWRRDLGADGGRHLIWTGRIAVIGAVTTAWDTHHNVVSQLGDRFVLLRTDSTVGRLAAGRQAIANTTHEEVMRAELASAVGGAIAGIDTRVRDLTDDEQTQLLAAADLVTLARTGVEYDYRGEVVDAHAPEMPTRFAKELAQVVRGGLALGMTDVRALQLAIRCARSSVPPLRLACVDDLAAHPESTTHAVRKRLDKPRATVDRQLQALHFLGVLTCAEIEHPERGTRWLYSIADHVDPAAVVVPEMSPHTPNP